MPNSLHVAQHQRVQACWPALSHASPAPALFCVARLPRHACAPMRTPKPSCVAPTRQASCCIAPVPIVASAHKPDLSSHQPPRMPTCTSHPARALHHTSSCNTPPVEQASNSSRHSHAAPAFSQQVSNSSYHSSCMSGPRHANCSKLPSPCISSHLHHVIVAVSASYPHQPNLKTRHLSTVP